MDKTKTIALAVLIFIFGLSAGLIFGVTLQKKVSQPAPVKSQAETEKACWEQAKQRLIDSGLIPSSDNSKQEIKAVYGTVESISGNNISLKIKPFDLLADPDLDNRIISFDSSTKIYQLEKVAGGGQPDITPPSATSSSTSDSSSGVVHYGGGATEANLKDLENKNKSTVPKINYQSKEAKIEDIKAGDTISVLSDSNIRDSKNIQAKGITLIPATAQ